ncbi:MAG: L-aspartate oxidase [Myxococcota bacterium]
MPKKNKNSEFHFDVLVIGAGIGGLIYSLKAAKELRVALISKESLEESNTLYAQGGIAAVAEKDDSFDSHIQDTVICGAGLCKPEIVELVVTQAPERIKELVRLGVNFSLRMAGYEEGGEGAGNGYDLGREGGHSYRRIFHAGDITGRSIVKTLIKHIRGNKNITVFEKSAAIDLIDVKKFSPKSESRIVGAYVLDCKKRNVMKILAPAVVLATGGAGKAYQFTSNPDIATGDGVAMAYRAGAAIANMEFYQFHPTLHFEPRFRTFLISEALRGEGAILKTIGGKEFMHKYHKLGILAPRDIVARAIDAEMKKSGDAYVLLDISHKEPSYIKKRFPNIYKHCKAFGTDITREPIPVIPAAHYACGGVYTDRRGRTEIPGLYAIGETAYTGMHGANRLASNSLLEALVFANNAAEDTLKTIYKLPRLPKIPDWDVGRATEPDEMVVVNQNWQEIRRLMWNYVGIVRSDKRLIRARRRLQNLEEEIRQFYWDFTITRELIELRNLVVVAQIIVESALSRRENRGLHYNIDCADASPSDKLLETIVHRRGNALTVTLNDLANKLF